LNSLSEKRKRVLTRHRVPHHRKSALQNSTAHCFRLVHKCRGTIIRRVHCAHVQSNAVVATDTIDTTVFSSSAVFTATSTSRASSGRTYRLTATSTSRASSARPERDRDRASELLRAKRRAVGGNHKLEVHWSAETSSRVGLRVGVRVVHNLLTTEQ
jgi:hypothetical protein